MPVKLTSSASDEGGDEARIEVIPLIDIMFFLLAAFMLVSLSMTHMKRVPLDLPEASTAAAETREPAFQIAIDAHGVTTWEGAVVTLSEITARLQAAGAGPTTQVMISADENALHKQVLGVLNAVRAAGVTQIQFETED
jgi:biopolymer transport protein ExbD